MSNVTEKQAENLTDIMILTELWVSKWTELLDSGYEAKLEFKHNAKLFKGSLEKLQRQLFEGARHKLSAQDYKDFEINYMNKVSEIEILIQEYLRGKVMVVED